MASGSGFNLIDEDPKFVRNPSPGMDATWGTKDDDRGDLRLRFDSPAIDAGSTLLLPADTFDLDGDGDTAEPIPSDMEGGPRVEGSQVDIGAFEGVAVAPRAVLAMPIIYAVGHTDVWFDGTGSYDPNDDPLTYLWQIDLDGDGNYDGPGGDGLDRRKLRPHFLRSRKAPTSTDGFRRGVCPLGDGLAYRFVVADLVRRR